MDATFRPRRSLRKLGVACFLGFTTLGVLGVSAILTDPEVPHPVALVALVGGVSLVMSGMSAWIVVASWREEIAIRGERIAFRGVFLRSEIDLRDVVEARWRTRPVGGSLVLRTSGARRSIEFATYETEERDRIVRHLRSMLPAEVQVGWNLFAFKITSGEPRSTPNKPGPDEVLLRRERWDRYLVPSLVVAGLAGIVSWWVTRESRFLIAPAAPLGLLAMMRVMTPAEGMVASKLAAATMPERASFLRFLLIWGLVACVGLIAFERFRPGLGQPDAALIVGAVLWMAILLAEAGLHDRRRSRRENEAADLAAKARGEADHWRFD